MKNRRYPWRTRLGNTGPVFILLFFLIVWIFICTNMLKADPKRIGNVLPGACSICHNGEKVLPENHPITRDMDMSGCRECHEGRKTGLRRKIPLGHIHGLNDVSCKDCHGNSANIGPVKKEVCLDCHGSVDEVANATKGMDPDPHNSPHYGKDLDCDLCHHQHSMSENFCSQCHEWELLVP